MPGIACRVLRLFPRQLGIAAVLVPVTLHVFGDVVPVELAVTAAALPAVTIGRLVLLIRAAGFDIRARGVVFSPVVVLDRRVHLFGDALARESAGDAADRGSDARPD